MDGALAPAGWQGAGGPGLAVPAAPREPLRMRALRSLGPLATLLCLWAGGAGGTGLQAEEPAPQVVFVPDGGDTKLEGQGASVALTSAHDRGAAVVDVPGQTAWARVFVRRLKLDIRSMQHLDLDLKHVAGEAQEILVALLDAQNREATLRTPSPQPSWETRRLDLGDLRVDPGFDPAQVTTLQLVWKPAKTQSLAVGKITLVPGPVGWRHSAEEQSKRVFGPQRAREVKSEATEHFEIWSDDAKALKTVGAALEARHLRVRRRPGRRDLRPGRLQAHRSSSSSRPATTRTTACARWAGRRSRRAVLLRQAATQGSSSTRRRSRTPSCATASRRPSSDTSTATAAARGCRTAQASTACASCSSDRSPRRSHRASSRTRPGRWPTSCALRRCTARGVDVLRLPGALPARGLGGRVPAARSAGGPAEGAGGDPRGR